MMTQKTNFLAECCGSNPWFM